VRRNWRFKRMRCGSVSMFLQREATQKFFRDA
jgi:hypothetical protein